MLWQKTANQIKHIMGNEQSEYAPIQGQRSQQAYGSTTGTTQATAKPAGQPHHTSPRPAVSPRAAPTTSPDVVKPATHPVTTTSSDTADSILSATPTPDVVKSASILSATTISPSAAKPAAPTIPSKIVNISPLLEYVAKHALESDIIAMLAEFCLSKEQFESFDQYLIIGPVMILFHRCVLENKSQVVSWLMENYYPLQVSYDNNVCYFHAKHKELHEITKAITEHHSFVPTKSMLYMWLVDTDYEKKVHADNKSQAYTSTLALNLQLFRKYIRHPNVHPQIAANANLLDSFVAKQDIDKIKIFLRGVQEDNVYIQSMFETHGPIDMYAQTDSIYAAEDGYIHQPFQPRNQL